MRNQTEQWRNAQPRRDPFTLLKKALINGELGLPFLIVPGGGVICLDLTPYGSKVDQGFVNLNHDGTWTFTPGDQEGLDE